MAQITYSYPMGVKREIKDALQDVFSKHPDVQQRKTKVSLEFPLDLQKYPAIFITYDEKLQQNVGLGHIEYTEDDTPRYFKRWRFEGQINFNIYALTTQDRDMLGSTLINLLAFSDEIPEFTDFQREIYDSDFVSMTIMSDNVVTAGDQPPITADWSGGDELVYPKSYSVNVNGEFFTDPTTAQLIEINDIDLFPYQAGLGDPVPTGANDPAPWTP